jgi:Ca2+:H+ antiporter
MSMVALSKGDIRVVQANMIGSVLSNLLLGLGCCIMAAGGFAGDSTFNAEAAGAMSSLMTLASAAIIIPAVYVAFDARQQDELLNSVLVLSRGTSIVLLVLYLVYLDFSLRTHAKLFEEPKVAEPPRDPKKKKKKPVKLSPHVAISALTVVTFLIGICSDNIVSELDDIASHLHINKSFISLIILPAVGNAAEYITAITSAQKNNMNFAVSVAVGSSLQISLLVCPVLVMAGWAMGVPMTLHFEPFYVIVFFLSVLIVGMLVADGASNHLEGAMLVGM